VTQDPAEALLLVAYDVAEGPILQLSVIRLWTSAPGSLRYGSSFRHGVFQTWGSDALFEAIEKIGALLVTPLGPPKIALRVSVSRLFGLGLGSVFRFGGSQAGALSYIPPVLC
jgi:hypothetical protein